jgi:hypothetical protein
MKTKILVLFVGLIFFLSLRAFSQDNGGCLFPLYFNEDPPTDSLPEYMSPDWGMPKEYPLVVAFFDFPDGRWNDNGVLKQPLTNAQLSQVPNLDAAAEVGLTFEENPGYYVDEGLYTNASKYTWYNRWDLYFSQGTYYGDAHPDYETHNHLPQFKDEAYGSLKEYWLEVSNQKAIVIPGITHPNESDPKLKTGIVNDYFTLPDGRKIIKYFTLPKNKYGSNPNTAYFPSYYDIGGGLSVWSACKTLLTSLQGQIDFHYTNFINSGGKIVFVIAGGHHGFRGVADEISTIVIQMEAKPDSLPHRINGLSNVAHEVGHCMFKFRHSIAGRMCLMNTNNRRDLNCPTHVNPIFKLRKGWMEEPVFLENSQNAAQLDPMETSKQVGIITIYGQPSAAPDYLSGECYIIENRRRLGFDQLILKEEEPNLNFKGGILVWHYSPYKGYDYGSVCGDAIDPTFKLITPGDISFPNICGSFGAQEWFFAYAPDIQPGEIDFYNLGTDRTYSSHNLITGIDISDMEQEDYGDVNSPVQFDLNYLIREPTAYDKVICPQSGVQRVETLSGVVFVHKKDDNVY